MIKKIHELRERNHAEKERIAFVGATLITFFIVLFWLAGMTAFSKIDQNQKADSGGPVKELLASFTGVFKK
jgi:hypothetical protein